MKPLCADEVRRITRVLESILEDRLLLDEVPAEDRAALLQAAGKLAHPTRDEQRRLIKSLRRNEREQKRERDRAARAASGIRVLRQDPVFRAPLLPKLPAPEVDRDGEGERERVLEKPASCYVCKSEYRQVHFFYDSMCRDCGDLNYAKRFQKAPLEGKVALITGARVKIGFQASLMLLRSGARVIATTRFPNDAALRYSREPDFEAWAHRLQIHGLDLRHAPSVEVLARHLAQTHDRLDILINNAAQTVRRPPGFYGHLLETEQLPVERLPESCAPLLEGHRVLVEKVRELGATSTEAQSSPLAPSWRSIDPSLGIHSSAALSMVPYAFENEHESDKLFPAGALDADLQQVDLRAMNSWRLTLSEVATAEMLEVHLVNAVAPFILCGKLKPLMLRDRRTPGHIVNVSAMEGSFSRGTKTDKHPHTNMAKAALHMMTLTSAPEYAKSGIYMNAVDTGWVTDEDPIALAQKKVEAFDFQPPLDIVDGAARVVDPVFVAENGGELCFGKFFKDYRPTSW